jgi:hypothetical protein
VVRPPYPEVLRLYSIAEDHWPSLCARYYLIDLIMLPPHRFLTLVLGWLKEVVAPDRWDQFVYELSAPIPGMKATENVIEMEGDTFMSAMTTLNPGG